MKKRMAGIGAVLLVLLGPLADILGIIPDELKAKVEEHWWVGWVVAALFLVVWLYHEMTSTTQVRDSAKLQKESDDLRKEIRDLRSEQSDLREERSDLREKYRSVREEHGSILAEHSVLRAEHSGLLEECEELWGRIIAAASSPAGTATGRDPVVRLSGPDMTGSGSAQYLISNGNEGYRIENLTVESLTPGVDVTGISHTSLCLPQGRHADGAIVDVVFSGKGVVPWAAHISYDASRRLQITQQLA